MILVVGATGMLGGAICRRLRAAGVPVRALVRGGADRVAALDVDPTPGDLRDPDSLRAACEDVRTVVSTATAVLPRQPGDSIDAVDRDGHLALVDAAVAAGVRHFVHVSVAGSLVTPCPLTNAKRAVERYLHDAALAATILRPQPFMEIWLGPPLGFDLPGGAVTVFGSGEEPVSWIAAGDVAEFAARCASEPDMHGATIELGGPQAVSPLDVVRIAEDIGGRPVTVKHVPAEELERRKAAAESPSDASFADFMLTVARGSTVDMRPTLDRLPVALTPVRDYVRRVVTPAPTSGVPPSG